MIGTVEALLRRSCPVSPRILRWSLAGLVLLALSTTSLLAEEASERDRFRSVVERHLEAYPKMAPQDLYKLVYQAAMGNGHAMPDRESAARWLDRELADLTDSPRESLCLPLSPDGSLVRLDLRAFVRLDGSRDGLLDAMEATADRIQGSEERLERYWAYLEDLAEAGEIPFEKERLVEFFSGARAGGYRGVHHSDDFRELYHPAYRVVLRELVVLAATGGCSNDRAGDTQVHGR